MYKRQIKNYEEKNDQSILSALKKEKTQATWIPWTYERLSCLLYTSDAADERSSVDLGGRRIIKKKNNIVIEQH